MQVSLAWLRDQSCWSGDWLGAAPSAGAERIQELAARLTMAGLEVECDHGRGAAAARRDRRRDALGRAAPERRHA